MLSSIYKTFYVTLSLLLGFSLTLDAFAAEEIPKDVGYMLEDMYGRDKQKWPDTIYSQDLNQDGKSDWVARTKNCTAKESCPADIFICIPNSNGKCSEYCYLELKSLDNLKEKLATLKCESTC